MMWFYDNSPYILVVLLATLAIFMDDILSFRERSVEKRQEG